MLHWIKSTLGQIANTSEGFIDNPHHVTCILAADQRHHPPQWLMQGLSLSSTQARQTPAQNCPGHHTINACAADSRSAEQIGEDDAFDHWILCVAAGNCFWPGFRTQGCCDRTHFALNFFCILDFVSMPR